MILDVVIGLGYLLVGVCMATACVCLMGILFCIITFEVIEPIRDHFKYRHHERDRLKSMVQEVEKERT